MKAYAIGNFTLDIVASPVLEVPPWGTEALVQNLLFRTAGNLGNFCLASANMGLYPEVVGNVGQDPQGNLILGELREAGFDTRGIRVERNIRTSVTLALVKEGGERLFITFPGQLELITKAFVESYIAGMEEGSLVLLCSLFQQPNLHLDDVIDLAEALKAKGCKLLVDPGWDPGNWQKETLDGIRELLPKLDYFLPNFEEAKKIAGSEDEIQVLSFFQRSGAANLIIKQGPLGCLAWVDGRQHRSKAYAATVNDTTAAGDVFNAAVVYCLRSRSSTARMLDFANAAASLLISRQTDRFPALEEIEAVVAGDERI